MKYLRIVPVIGLLWCSSTYAQEFELGTCWVLTGESLNGTRIKTQSIDCADNVISGHVPLSRLYTNLRNVRISNYVFGNWVDTWTLEPYALNINYPNRNGGNIGYLSGYSKVLNNNRWSLEADLKYVSQSGGTNSLITSRIISTFPRTLVTASTLSSAPGYGYRISISGDTDQGALRLDYGFYGEYGPKSTPLILNFNPSQIELACNSSCGGEVLIDTGPNNYGTSVRCGVSGYDPTNMLVSLGGVLGWTDVSPNETPKNYVLGQYLQRLRFKLRGVNPGESRTERVNMTCSVI